jgi:hypothetical protein
MDQLMEDILGLNLIFFAEKMTALWCLSDIYMFYVRDSIKNILDLLCSIFTIDIQ